MNTLILKKEFRTIKYHWYNTNKKQKRINIQRDKNENNININDLFNDN